MPATGYKDKNGKPLLWESCVTINTDSWGYNKYETDFKTPRDLIRMLVEVVSKGGNLLLNIGPMPDAHSAGVRNAAECDGRLDEGQQRVHLADSPPVHFRDCRLLAGDCQGQYAISHVFQWPADGRLRLPGLRTGC